MRKLRPLRIVGTPDRLSDQIVRSLPLEPGIETLIKFDIDVSLDLVLDKIIDRVGPSNCSPAAR